MATTRSRILALVIAAGVAIVIVAGVELYFIQQAPSEVHVRVREMRFSIDDGSGEQGADTSVLGRLARAVTSQVVVDSWIEVESALPVSATLESVSWTITVGGVDVGGGATPPSAEQIIAADGASVITAKTRIPVTKIAKVLIQGRGATAEITGMARVRVLGISIEREFEADATQIARGGTLADVMGR